MSSDRVTILGGGYAGLMSAVRLAKRKVAHITLVDSSPTFVERIRLHQLAAGGSITQHRFTDLLAGTGITVVTGAATDIDTRYRQVTVRTDDGVRTLPHDYLVYALGSVTSTDQVPGVAAYAFTLNSPTQAQRLATRLVERTGPSNVVVCGAGLAGVEAATEIAEVHRSARVWLVSRDVPGATLGPKARAHVKAALDRCGITVVARQSVVRVLPTAVELSSGELLQSDATLWTGGVQASPLAAEAGISVDARGMVQVDPALRSMSHPEIFAVGDAAAVWQAWGKVHGTCQSAVPAGAHAADQITRLSRGGEPVPFRFGYLHQAVSLGRHDGVVQFVNPDNTPRDLVLTGRWAVRYKELVSVNPLRVHRITALPARGGAATRRLHSRGSRASSTRLATPSLGNAR